MATTPRTVEVAVELDDESVERIRRQVAEAVRSGIRDGLDGADLGVRHKGGEEGVAPMRLSMWDDGGSDG